MPNVEYLTPTKIWFCPGKLSEIVKYTPEYCIKNRQNLMSQYQQIRDRHRIEIHECFTLYDDVELCWYFENGSPHSCFQKQKHPNYTCE